MPTHNRDQYDDQDIGLLPIFTLVLWVTCLIVGLVGFVQDDQSTPPATQPTEPPPVEMLSVDLTSSVPQPQPSPLPAAASPAAAEQTMLPAPAPTVAAPRAFLQIQPLTPQAPAQPAPIRLTLGQGQGRQPSPDYPRQAVLAGEEGTVVAQFTIDTDGRVEDAQATIPSPWPILNQSVLRTIRHDWRFSPGPPRRYEVAIVFQINRQ
ncbi:MAG: energy transducer TonB [Tepidisphaeraceae bacterium]|jgi:protein TonB